MQFVIVPVVVGMWVAATPMVSATVLGENASVGFAMSIPRFKAAVPDPMLFVAVMV